MFSKLFCVTLILAVLGQTTALSCNDIKPVSSLNLIQFHGKWAVVELLHLPSDDPPSVPPRPSPRCVSAKVKTDDSHVFLKLKSYLSEEEILTRRCTFGVSSIEPGRWSKQSNITTSRSHEILVVAANSDKFLVLLHCEPGQNTTILEPVRVCFLSRRVHDGHDDHSEEHSREHDRCDKNNHVPVTEEELNILRADVANILGLTEITTSKLHTDCFH